MPNQREQAVQRNKKQREQALRRQQQRKQQKQPAQPTRTPQPQPQPQPQPPRMIVPDFTDRAKKLGELIALYLRGDWNYNQGLQTARQYAPNGTTEAELRAAVIHAARVQGNVGNLSIRALVQPEVLHPKVNVSDLPKQGTLQNVVRGAQAPLRSVAAGATYLAGRANPRGQYGRESGGKPFPAPQSFAESYASDPTFGSALELAFPNVHPLVRIIAGGALDLLLDPVNLLGAGAVKQAVGKTTQAIAKPVGKIAEPVRRTVSAVGTRVMHPTAAKTATQLAKTTGVNKTRLLDELGKLLEPDSRFYAIVRSFGDDISNINHALDEVNRTLRVYNPNIAAYQPLSFEELMDSMIRRITRDIDENIPSSIRNPIEPVLEQVSERTQSLLDEYRNLANQITDERVKQRVLNSLDSAESLITQYNRKKDAYLTDFEKLLPIVDTFVVEFQSPDLAHSVLSNTANRVFQREIAPKRDIVRRGIDAWKRTKTVYNPATHTRNFVQNFLFHYLAGNISLPELIHGIRDLPRLVFRARQALDEGVLPLESVNRLGIQAQFTGTLSDAIMAGLYNKHSRFGRILPVNNQTPNDALVFAGTSLQDMPIPVANLPRNWGELIRKITVDALAGLRENAKRMGWRGAIAQFANDVYNWGDRLPAMIMETGVRKQLIPFPLYRITLGDNSGLPGTHGMTGAFERLERYPFRMEYASVPETIGALNIALLPFFNYQYFALRGLRQGLLRNPERIQNILAKPVERATRITQADDEQGVSQSTRFGFPDREMIQLSDSRGLPFSTIYPIDPHFAEPLLSPADWLSRSPITAIARPIVQNRDDLLGMLGGLAREFTPPSAIHAWYALFGEPQRGMQPALQHTRAERLLRALGFNIQPLDAMRMARQQQRQAEQQQREQLRFDPANIGDIVKQILRRFGM